MSALSHVYPEWSSRPFACRQTLAALAVSAVAGFAIFATTAGSLMEGAQAAAPAAKGPPPGWIDIAFAQVDTARVDAAWAATAVRLEQNRIVLPQNTQKQDTQKQDTQKQDTQKQDPCADFVYYFLNTTCSIKRVGSARRDSVVRRAVAARMLPLPAPKQEASRHPERVTFAATDTTATD